MKKFGICLFLILILFGTSSPERSINKKNEPEPSKRKDHVPIVTLIEDDDSYWLPEDMPPDNNNDSMPVISESPSPTNSTDISSNIAVSLRSHTKNDSSLINENLSRKDVGSLSSNTPDQKLESCPNKVARSSTNDGILNMINYCWKRFQIKLEHWTWHDTLFVMVICCLTDGCTLTLYYTIRFIHQKYNKHKEKRTMEIIRMQRKRRVLELENESESESEEEQQVLREAPQPKPWRPKLKKKRRKKDDW